MKDLKRDLEDRLGSVTDERKQLQIRLAKLTELEQALALLIREEGLRTDTEQLSLMPVRTVKGQKVMGHTVLSQFIAKALGDGKPRSRKELERLAKTDHINFKDKSPGRVIHFALVGLQRNNYAKMVEPGVWQLTANALNEVQQSKEENTPEIGKNEETATVAGL
ncbi:MAG: hypothetical protein ABSA18_05920 [Dehalococcoidia bacterium]|jgi:hypothetical protein